MALRDIVRWERLEGKPVAVPGAAVTPESRALTLRLPHVGLVWNRPIAITIDRDGRKERIPISDFAGWVQLGLGLTLLALSMTVLRRKRRNRHG